MNNLFDKYNKVQILIDNITSAKLKVEEYCIGENRMEKYYELRLKIKDTPEIFKDKYISLKDEDIIAEDTKIFHDRQGKDELYYKGYNCGIYLYGMYGYDQWWSSRCEVINSEFGTNIKECVINNIACAIDIELEKLIIDKFNLIGGIRDEQRNNKIIRGM